MLLRVEQVDPAVDEVEQARGRPLLLDLLLDEPQEELEGPVVLGVAGRVGEDLELAGDLALAGLRDDDRVAGGRVARRGAARPAAG